MIEDKILIKDKELDKKNRSFLILSVIFLVLMTLSMVGILGSKEHNLFGMPLTLFLAIGFCAFFVFVIAYAYKSLFKPWAEKFDAQDKRQK